MVSYLPYDRPRTRGILREEICVLEYITTDTLRIQAVGQHYEK